MIIPVGLNTEEYFEGVDESGGVVPRVKMPVKRSLKGGAASVHQLVGSRLV